MLNEEFRTKLPMDDFEKLGLFKNNDLKVSQPNLLELLAGRRTDFIELKSLEHEGIFIDRLKAKLSMKENEDGSRALYIHPIYKNLQKHSSLTDKEMNQLVHGDKANIKKDYTDQNGKKSKMIIEYDKETNEFVSLDVNKILIPEMINNEVLSPAQKAKLKEGEEINLNDGTKIQPSPTANNGVRSNRSFLILSILIDGGMSYLLIKAAQKLLGTQNEQSSPQSLAYTEGYKDALKKMEEQKWTNKNSNFVNFSDDHHKQDLDEQSRQRQSRGNQESRGYSRGGQAR